MANGKHSIAGIDVIIGWSALANHYCAWLKCDAEQEGAGGTPQAAIDDLRSQLDIGECPMHGEYLDDCPKC